MLCHSDFTGGTRTDAGNSRFVFNFSFCSISTFPTCSSTIPHNHTTTRGKATDGAIGFCKGVIGFFWCCSSNVLCKRYMLRSAAWHKLANIYGWWWWIGGVTSAQGYAWHRPSFSLPAGQELLYFHVSVPYTKNVILDRYYGVACMHNPGLTWLYRQLLIFSMTQDVEIVPHTTQPHWNRLSGSMFNASRTAGLYEALRL